MSMFLSYSKEDRKFVENLHTALSRYLNAFVDTQSIPGGAEWERKIDKAIRECKVFVPVVTQDSNDSHWVTKETLLALDLKKPIVPVLLSDSLPLRIIDRQFVDFRKSFETGFADLLSTVSQYFGELKPKSDDVDILIASAIKERLKGNIQESNALVEQFVGPNSGLASDGYWFWRKLLEVIDTNYAEKYLNQLTIHENTVLSKKQDYKDTSSYKWSIELHGSSEVLGLVDSVVYTLHPTFRNPIQKVRSQEDNFRLERIGWGVFLVKVRVQFVDYTAIDGSYMLTFKNQNTSLLVQDEISN